MSIPYHLRQNKAVDRNIFLDILKKISRHKKISDYAYIGFGGAFLKDFKDIHVSLDIEEMHSIELEEWIYKRQALNSPVSCIQYHHMHSQEFISEKVDDIVDRKNIIIWLDYVTSNIGEQMAELSELVTKLSAGDIVRVTLNASTSQFNSVAQTEIYFDEETNECKPLKLSHEQILNNRLEAFKEKVSLPSNMEANDLSDDNYCNIGLVKLLKHTVNSAKPSNLKVLPLGFYRYKDGATMLTVTFILIDRHQDEQYFYDSTELSGWPLKTNDFDSKPFHINMPVISAVEKAQIDSNFPLNDVRNIDIPFQLDKKQTKSAKMLEDYGKYYKYFPTFSKVEF